MKNTRFIKRTLLGLAGLALASFTHLHAADGGGKEIQAPIPL